MNLEVIDNPFDGICSHDLFSKVKHVWKVNKREGEGGPRQLSFFFGI